MALQLKHIVETNLIRDNYVALLSHKFCHLSSYTMGTSGLPDIHTQSPRAAGPKAEGVYIRQTTSAHGITTM